jgi:hypothetical protein
MGGTATAVGADSGRRAYAPGTASTSQGTAPGHTVQPAARRCQFIGSRRSPKVVQSDLTWILRLIRCDAPTDAEIARLTEAVETSDPDRYMQIAAVHDAVERVRASMRWAIEQLKDMGSRS